MSAVRALSVTALVVVATSVAVAGPGLVGATGAGNHTAAGNTSIGDQTTTPGGGTDGTAPAGGNTTTDGNGTVDGNATAGRNTTRDGNTTARGQAIERGPARRPNPRPRGPRISPDVVVDDDGKAHYRTLSAAVENAREDETILVHPGTYDGGVRVDVDGLTIVGVGPEETELVGTGTGTAVVVAASDVTVQSVGVHGYETGVAVEAGDGEVTENVEFANLTVERVTGDGVRIETRGHEARVSNVTVESSELRLGGVVGWSGRNASSAGNASEAGSEDNRSVAAESTVRTAASADNRSAKANNASGADNRTATGIPVDDGPVTGVAVESRAGSVAEIRVENTTVSDLGTGIRLSGPDGSISGLRVVGSEFHGNDRGLEVADGAVHSVEVSGTVFQENEVGLLVQEPVDASAVTVRGSRFSDNDVGLWSRAAGTVDAEGNDWAAPAGPAAPGNPDGDGDVVRGNVDVDPWLPPVVRLEDEAASSGRLTVELVAHPKRLSGYEVVVAYGPARVEDAAVEGGAMPASVDADGDVLVVSGSTSSPVTGPVVLATISFEGDLEAVADELELRGERSVAYGGDGRALESAFLTGNLSVDVEDGEGEEPPAETPTEVPVTETPEGPTTPTESPPTPNGSEQGTGEETPRATDAGTAAADETPIDDERRQASTDAPDGETERPTDGPGPLDLPSIQRRLSAVGDTLSKLGDLLRSLVGVPAAL